jgi:hypothetical protein
MSGSNPLQTATPANPLKSVAAPDSGSPTAPVTRKTKNHHQTETPEFKRWFGDSKTLEDNGTPMILHHGSGAKRIDEFRPERIGTANDEGFYGRGFYFARDKQLANDYVPEKKGKPSGAVHSMYVRTENPFIWDLTTPDAQKDTIERAQKIVPDLQVTTTGINKVRTPPLKWTEALKDAGYDGVHIMAPKDYSALHEGRYGDVGREISEVVAFDPNQIKSATHNNGKFDPKNPNVRS